jgi:hypothetical protein
MHGSGTLRIGEKKFSVTFVEGILEKKALIS